MPVLTSPPLTVVFDGDCGICQALARALAGRDRHHRLRFAAYQRADLGALSPGLTRDMAARSVVAVAPDGSRWQGARAIAEALRQLPGVWGWIGRIGTLPPVPLLAEPVYRLAARHRRRLSRWFGLAQCRPEMPHGP